MPFKMFSWGLILALGCTIGSCRKGELDPSQPGNLVPLTAELDATIPSIAVNGTLLHSEAFGPADSALVIVIHGGPGSDYRHLLNCKELATQGFRVVFYDQRGSGLSQRYNMDEYSLDLMTDDLRAVIDYYTTAPNQKVFLLGHSWGAMLATAYINTHPGEIDGAILCEPGGLTYPQVKEYLRRSQDFGPFSETLSDAVYLDQFFTGSENEHAILDYKFGLWSSADFAEDSPIGDEGPLPYWRSGAVVNKALFEIAEQDGFDWTTNLYQYDTEILFVYSENNRAYGEQHAKNVSAPYPRVQLFRCDDAGHDMLSFPRGWQNFYPVGLSYLNNLK